MGDQPLHAFVTVLAEEKSPGLFFQNVLVTLAGGLLCFRVGWAQVRTGRGVTAPSRTLRIGDALVAPAPPRRSRRIQGWIWIGASGVFALGFLFNLASGLYALLG
ncbi:hypothetical protein ACQEVM_18755 [Streptomyces sp. CA-243310]|uniref:hypothetical protein n=1 Tax=Streptomyces sp. CA-243310 TaxID=3240056 RepID=UPI003D8D867F